MSDLEDIRAEAELRYLQLGRELENPEGWKRVVMKHLFIDQKRKERKFPTVELDGSETYIDESNNSAGLDLELYAAIALLPEKQKMVVNERLNGRKFKEIATELNISINTALGLYRYAVLNLRKIMNVKQ